MKQYKKNGSPPQLKAALAALGASLGVAMVPVATAADGSVKPNDATKSAKQTPSQANAVKLNAGQANSVKLNAGPANSVKLNAGDAKVQKVSPAGADQLKSKSTIEQKVAPSGAQQYKPSAGSQQLKIDSKVKNAPATK
jgi:hypothetical protein